MVVVATSWQINIADPYSLPYRSGYVRPYDNFHELVRTRMLSVAVGCSVQHDGALERVSFGR